MTLQEALIRSVAAEEDAGTRYKLAAAMLVGHDTSLLADVYLHALNVAYDEIATDRQRSAARIVVEALALQMLMRVEAMDEEIARMLDQGFEQRSAEEEFEPLVYDRDEGFSIFLEPDHEDVEDVRDLALDLQAEPGRVYVSM